MDKYISYLLIIAMLAISCKSGTESANSIIEEISTNTDKHEIRSEKQNSFEKKNENQNSEKKSNLNSNIIIINKKLDPNQVDEDLLEDLIYTEVNKIRSGNGLQPLEKDKVLLFAASNQNLFQLRNNQLSHIQKKKGFETVRDRVNYYGGKGYTMLGENLIYEGFLVKTSKNKIQEVITPTYQALSETIVRNWMNSEGHRENILNPNFTLVGTAVHFRSSNHAIYATQVFGKK